MNLSSYINNDGIIILDKHQWKSFNDHYTPKIFKKVLCDFIVKNQLPFPYKKFEYKDFRDNFTSFCNDNLSHYWIKDCGEVLEKPIRQDLAYSKTGKGILQLGHSYNLSSNYFHQQNRYSCSGYSIESCVHRWKTGEGLESLLSSLWRMNNDELSVQAYHGAFRLSGYIATQFKPHIAKLIYSKNNSKIILDTSCGWGDRLCAFYATSSAQQYYGCDPNTESYEIYKKQCIEYEKILNMNQEPKIIDHGDWFECIGVKKVVIQNKPAEEMIWKDIPDIDCAFTSPPYFSTERYAKNTECMNKQSWYRYTSYSEWRDNFFIPVSKHTIAKSKNTYINIVNPKINGVNYPVCEDLIDLFKDKFSGQYGMRIKQRPRNICKDSTNKLFKMMYIEPIWIFSH